MLKKNLRTGLILAAALFLFAGVARAQYLMENLGRGVVAVRQNASDVYVGWRLLGTDPSTVAFNLSRSTGGGPAVQLNAAPVTDTTNFIDTTADLTQPNSYFVRPVVNGVERAPSSAFTLAANGPAQQYLNIPLQIPAGGTSPDGVSYTYTANDASVGDVDGDGEAEVACKTAPGTIDGAGQFVLRPGDDPAADYRNSSGYVLSGPEYLTVFNGLTGAALATVSYDPPRGTVSSWGDS